MSETNEIDDNIIENHGIDGTAILVIDLAHCDLNTKTNKFELVDYMGFTHEAVSVIKDKQKLK